jgi:hypothetical protein
VQFPRPKGYPANDRSNHILTVSLKSAVLVLHFELADEHIELYVAFTGASIAGLPSMAFRSDDFRHPGP